MNKHVTVFGSGNRDLPSRIRALADRAGDRVARIPLVTGLPASSRND